MRSPKWQPQSSQHFWVKHGNYCIYIYIYIQCKLALWQNHVKSVQLWKALQHPESAACIYHDIIIITITIIIPSWPSSPKNTYWILQLEELHKTNRRRSIGPLLLNSLFFLALPVSNIFRQDLQVFEGAGSTQNHPRIEVYCFWPSSSSCCGVPLPPPAGI